MLCNVCDISTVEHVYNFINVHIFGVYAKIFFTDVVCDKVWRPLTTWSNSVYGEDVSPGKKTLVTAVCYHF